MKLICYIFFMIFTLKFIDAQSLDDKEYSFPKVNKNDYLRGVKTLFLNKKITENTYYLDNKRFLRDSSYSEIKIMQGLKEKTVLFKPFELNHNLLFNESFDQNTEYYQTDNFVKLNGSTKTHLHYDTEKLNEKLFSNVNIVENTYKYYDDFFRLCSPLDDGVANTVDSHAGAMLGHILNNFLNNYILKSSEPKKISFRKN